MFGKLMIMTMINADEITDVARKGKLSDIAVTQNGPHFMQGHRGPQAILSAWKGQIHGTPK